MKGMVNLMLGKWIPKYGRAALLVLSSAQLGFNQPGFAEPQDSSDLLNRVVIIGASLSAGAGHMHELGAHASLGPFVQAIFTPEAFGPEASPPLDRGHYLSFVKPTLFGNLQVQAAMKHEASLAIGLDFLFWYAHGFHSDKERMRRLEIGLAEIDKLPCPILIGDLPDIQFALEGKSRLTGGPLVRRSMIPSTAVLAALNQRIHAWAAKRPRVTLAPLGKFVAQVQAGQSIELNEASLASKDFAELIQSDRLHPTVDGTLTLLAIAVDALVAARPELDAEDVLWDLDRTRQILNQRMEFRRAASDARRKRIRRLRGEN